MLAPWLSSGLKFSCTSCGKCCRSSRTNVWVNTNEVKAMATALKKEPFAFATNYCEDRETEEGELLTSLKNKDGACILLGKDGRTCSVYEARPMQCRTYPFWPAAVIGKAEWETEASRCEGINAPKAATHSLKDITRNLILGQIHDRGVGSDEWTYGEGDSLLADSERENPDMLPDFAQDFFRSHYSNVVYQSPALRVVDVTVPAPLDPLALSSADNSPVQQRITRRLDFVNSPALSQTEMLLTPGNGASAVVGVGQKGALTPDASALQMRVHALLAVGCETALDGAGGRMAMIGAGGCALPSYLLQKHAQITKGKKNESAGATPMLIDAVESNAEVLQVATKFFGARFLNKEEGTKAVAAGGGGGASGMFSYHMEGLAYLKHLNENEKASSSLDVLVVDAAESVKLNTRLDDQGEKEPVDLAPPPGFIHANGLELMLGSLKPGGALLLNLLGPPEWSAAVEQLITKFYFLADKEDKHKGAKVHTAFLPPKIVDVHALSATNRVLVTVRAGEGAEDKLANLVEAMAQHNENRYK